MKKIYFLLPVFLTLSFNILHAQITPNIVGGNDTDIDEVPWQVLLEINDQDVCGVSIIAPNWILTAAHCVEGLSPNDIRVIAGITLRSQKNNGQIRYVTQIIIHPDYDSNNFENDLALIQLSSLLG